MADAPRYLESLKYKQTRWFEEEMLVSKIDYRYDDFEAFKERDQSINFFFSLY